MDEKLPPPEGDYYYLVKLLVSTKGRGIGTTWCKVTTAPIVATYQESSFINLRFTVRVEYYLYLSAGTGCGVVIVETEDWYIRAYL
jgi:hypothetical protein